MEYNYEYVFFKYIYEKYNLSQVEKFFEQQKIKPLYLVDNKDETFVSKYFTLLNKGDTHNFSKEELNDFKRLFDQDRNTLLKNNYQECVNFIEKTYKKYFFDENKTITYKYYGPNTFEYMAPSDAIVLGILYNKYNIGENENSEQEIERQDEILIDIINYMQEKLNGENAMKVAVLRYNEIATYQPFVRL